MSCRVGTEGVATWESMLFSRRVPHIDPCPGPLQDKTTDGRPAPALSGLQQDNQPAIIFTLYLTETTVDFVAGTGISIDRTHQTDIDLIDLIKPVRQLWRPAQLGSEDAAASCACHIQVVSSEPASTDTTSS